MFRFWVAVVYNARTGDECFVLNKNKISHLLAIELFSVEER